MQIAKNAVVSFDYRLTDDGGELIDTSEGGAPLAYIHGIGAIIPGLESELEGKVCGDAFSVRIAPADGYGERDDQMIGPVPRDQLPDDVEIEIGMQFQAEGEDGAYMLTVVALEDDHVMMDANHPLAGVALNFDVTVREVREATPEELEHGHAHGPEGHEHD